MKKSLLAISLAILIVSCSKKNKYIGTWFFNDATSIYDSDTPMKLVFTKDSIEVIRSDFKPSNKYAFQLQDNNLVIENNVIKTKFKSDTLIINNRLKFFKDNSGKLIEAIGLTDPKIEINLPEIKSSNLITYPKKIPATYIRLGKRHDNGKFSLELNDKYSEFNELQEFAIDRSYYGQEKNKQYHYLFFDKSSKMKDLEKIFLTMASINELKILFVNNSTLITKDTLALKYENSILGTRISILENHTYFNSINKGNDIIPMFLESHYSQFFGKINNFPNIITLVKNKFYFNGTEFEKSELSKLLKEDIKNNNHLLSLYDLESDYYHFLKLQIAIRSTYNDFREEKSIIKYNKALNDLKKEQLDSIKAQTPIKHIWSYSIPHYKAVVKDGNYFFGMRVKPLDSILPMQ